jgi:hypothetical protein
MKHVWPVFMMVLMIIPVASQAFDGERKGVVIGGGLGVAPVARWSNGYDNERAVALAMHIIAGYAWNSDNMLVYEINCSLFASEQYNSDWLWGSGDLVTTQGFEGASWYHHFGRPGRSFFTAAGLGLFIFDRGRNYHSDPGAGYLLGSGFEFLCHFQLGAYLSGGRTFDAGRSFAHMNFSLLLSGVVY